MQLTSAGRITLGLFGTLMALFCVWSYEGRCAASPPVGWIALVCAVAICAGALWLISGVLRYFAFAARPALPGDRTLGYMIIVCLAATWIALLSCNIALRYADIITKPRGAHSVGEACH